MPSINEINLAVNSLFLDIINPITIGLNKANLLKKYTQLYFRLENNPDSEFTINPIFRFDSNTELKSFLEHELQLSKQFQDYENESEIKELLSEGNDIDTLDNFYLNYSIEINGDEINIFFSTNSLVFKYEVIG